MTQKKLVSKMLATALLVAVVSAGIVFATRTTSNDGTPNKLTVTASYYPLYDFAMQVGGDKVHVASIVPAGVEPHEFEPSPKALAVARGSKVFLYNGVLEPWAAKFAKDYPHIAVNTSKGVAVPLAASGDNDDSGLDPHFWLDPVLAQRTVADIQAGFTKADPDHAGYYAARAAVYTTKLKKLDQQFRSGLAQCDLHTIVASHDAFGYVARRYGFSVESIAGLNPESEPSPARLAALSDYIRTNHIKYVFFEELVSHRLAATIAQETGAKTSVLNPIEGLTHEDQAKGRDYLSIQQENLANLRTALACD